MLSCCILKDNHLYTGCCLSTPTSILLSLLSLKEHLISKLEPSIACSVFTHTVPAQYKSKRCRLKKKSTSVLHWRRLGWEVTFIGIIERFQFKVEIKPPGTERRLWSTEVLSSWEQGYEHVFSVSTVKLYNRHIRCLKSGLHHFSFGGTRKPREIGFIFRLFSVESHRILSPC